MQVGLAVAGGWLIGQIFKRTGVIGREITDAQAVSAILDDPAGPFSGAASASLRLAVFSDYRCPACRHAFPELEAAIEADGDIRVIYKDWPIFGELSEHAAQVALATVNQGIYPAVHRLLMTDNRVLDAARLRAIVEQAGGDWARVEKALESSAAITARLRSNGLEALSIGLPGTPGYLAGPIVVVGAIDRTDFARLFARARMAQASRIDAGT